MRTVRRYLPVESVTASKLFPLASLTARTTTPGSTPPVWSVTVPLIAASWANADIGSRRNGSARSAAITSRRNEMRDINFLLGMGLPGRCETCGNPWVGGGYMTVSRQGAVGSGQWAGGSGGRCGGGFSDPPPALQNVVLNPSCISRGVNAMLL